MIKAKRSHLILVLVVLAAVLAAVDVAWRYDQISRFPEYERKQVETWIEEGSFPKCDPRGDTGTVGVAQSDIKDCFSRSRITDQVINSSPGKPELDQVYIQMACQTDAIAGRFQLVVGRTDNRLWCQYRYGADLGKIAEFNMNDLVYTPEPSLLDRILSRVSGK
ncbi:hypothetical protein [Roseovarius indicus]|uniref:hypothetical protein n=1 Tax=Roseovarius indicus TaxID=540747 RepID=UPI0032EDFEAC